MQTVLLVIHLIVAVLLIGVIMLQKSEGGALGIGGGGSGGNLFSARGVGNALTRTTAFLAVGFFITSISLTMLAIHSSGGGNGGLLAPSSGSATQGSETAPSGNGVLPQLPGAAPAQPSQLPVQP